MNRSLKSLPQRVGRHRRGGPARPRGWSLGLRVTAVLSVAATAAVVALAVVPQRPTTARSAASAVALSAIPSPRLTAAQIQELKHLTPDQAAGISKQLETVFRKDGIRVGLGAFGTPASGQIKLTAYDWSGGVRWDHAWLTASYANLASAAHAANKTATVIQLASPACALIDGVGRVICGVIANIIALLVKNIKITSVSNHGVWGAYYWFTGAKTGGYW